MKSKGSCLALVCVSIKFIDFIFGGVSLLTHFKRKTKKNSQKQTTKKEAKNKQTNKQTNKNKNKNKTHTKKRGNFTIFTIFL